MNRTIFKKLILTALITLSALFATSCVVITDDYTVTIENRDSNREAYISKVEYKESWSSSWKSCWYYNSYTTDSHCTFDVPESGWYNFRITVIYPKYDGYRDYYDTFETSRNDDVYVSGITNKKLIFNGSSLYESY